MENDHSVVDLQITFTRCQRNR